jgi:hypothetical protein
MVKITLISDETDEETGKLKRVKLRLSFWSVMKMYLIGWFITTGVIVGIVLLARLIVDGTI